MNFTSEIYGFFNLSDQQQSTNMEYSINLFNNITNNFKSIIEVSFFSANRKLMPENVTLSSISIGIKIMIRVVLEKADDYFNAIILLKFAINLYWPNCFNNENNNKYLLVIQSIYCFPIYNSIDFMFLKMYSDAFLQEVYTIAPFTCNPGEPINATCCFCFHW